ncbi:helix-turn-helix domain-containing protein [Parabacteroides goldsteinii]|uniref:helix-turn-helix domain-containing protein n=1 Tax=Parabacteroides goldsteinii TaxID=328812 RepID=UPI0032B16F95
MIDLKRFREEQKISQAELCTVLGIAQPYLSAIENGKRPLNDKKFTLLYKHYGNITLKYKQSERPLILIDEADASLHPTLQKYLIERISHDKAEGVPPEFVEALFEERKRHDEERKRHDEMNAELIRQNGKLIQLLEESKKTVTVQKGDNATCADASGSGLGK